MEREYMFNLSVEMDLDMYAHGVDHFRGGGGGWLWSTEGTTKFSIGDSGFNVYNAAGTIYLSLYRVLPLVFEVIPPDLHAHLNARQFITLEERTAPWFESLEAGGLDRDSDEIADLMADLWSWKMRRTVLIDRVSPEPNVWLWNDGVYCHVEAIIPSEFTGASDGSAKCVSYKFPIENLLNICNNYQDQVMGQAQTNLVRFKVFPSLTSPELSAYFGPNLEPFTMESVKKRLDEPTDFDKVRNAYARLAKRAQ
jgi:hypothetical protein